MDGSSTSDHAPQLQARFNSERADSMRRLSVWVLAGIGLLLSEAVASDLDDQNLKGIRAVKVLIGEIGPEAQKLGLAKSTLTTDVELRLRQVGITVLPSGESGSPVLYVRVLVVMSSGVYAYSLDVQLYDYVTLVRNPTDKQTIAATWNALPGVGMTGSAQASEAIRQNLRDMVDQFVNAYLAANPKP